MSVHNLSRDEIDFLSGPKLLTTLSSYDVSTEHDSVPTENMDQAMVKPNDNLKIVMRLLPPLHKRKTLVLPRQPDPKEVKSRK